MIVDLQIALYPWIKALHIMAVVSWMAGLFYLPRLFVYHVERGQSKETSQTFIVMEQKLMKVIMNPAMAVTWVMGILLVLTPGVVAWGEIWPWTKLVGIIAMTGFHEWCKKRIVDFESGSNTQSGRYYRLMNEVPTILMVVIVVSVVVRPL